MERSEFDRDQFAEAYPLGIERSWWHIARNRIIADAFQRHLTKNMRILEVGCGTGIVTEHLRMAGWNVAGVDLGIPRSGIHVPQHLRLGINALALPAEERSAFGALALFDVIEHIADAPSFLRELLAAFPNVTRVIITVPARKELWTSFDEHYGHFRRYDRPMLRNELAIAGLVPAEVGYFFHGVYPAIVMNNLIRGRKRNLRFRAPAQGLASTLNAVIASVFAMETRILPSSWVGSSIIGVARRV